MSCVVDKTDVTANLPDEVLCRVFSFLTLSEKLRSESVNNKFKRCVINELKTKPQPLELDWMDLWNVGSINGYGMPPDRVFSALQTLANKSKFSDISIHIACALESERLERLDRILSVLISENQCLTKVTSFRINTGCSEAVLENILSQCDKLSTIGFDFDVCPLDVSTPNGYEVFPLDLCKLFNNKGVTELELRIYGYHQQSLVDMFRGIKPNFLRKLDLHLLAMPGLNVVELVNALKANASSTLEEMSLRLGVDCQLADLFDALALLPALQQCNIVEHSETAVDQFVPAATSLFKMSHVNITLRANRFIQLPACQIVTMIHQIQRVHPGLVVNFFFGGSGLILSLGNASVEKKFEDHSVLHCGADDCAKCQSFYPTLLHFLTSRALEAAALNSVEAQHFPNWQMDRCRAKMLDYFGTEDWRVLSIEATEDHQSVTICFETNGNDDLLGNDDLFSITIGCGRCLSNGCVKCLD